MTITAREAMQALLEGKVVTGLNTKWKLNGSGELIVEGVDGWNPSGNDLNHISSVVDDEYPLDFKHALKAMLKGKTVVCEENDWYAFRFRNGVFESSLDWDYYPKWDKGVIYTPMQEAKWKVVE